MDFKSKIVVGMFLSCKSSWALSDEEAIRLGGFDSPEEIASLSVLFSKGGAAFYNQDQFSRMSRVHDIALIIDVIINQSKGKVVSSIDILGYRGGNGRPYLDMMVSGDASELEIVHAELSTFSIESKTQPQRFG